MQTFTADNTEVGKWIALADDNDQLGELVEVIEVLEDPQGAYAFVTDESENERFLSFPFYGVQQV
jgi:hypothetical protein